MLTQGNFFKVQNELNTEGGESRVAQQYSVAESNTRRSVTQGGGTGRCLHKGIFPKGTMSCIRKAENPAYRRGPRSVESHKAESNTRKRHGTLLTQGNFFKGHNEVNTGGGEPRVAENPA